jgi:hypothetical protein
VPVADIEMARLVGFDRRVERAAFRQKSSMRAKLVGRGTRTEE